MSLTQDLSLNRVRELVEQGQLHVPAELAWELAIHADTLAEALKESAAQLRGVEEEKRHLQERLS
ncbi:MAG: hypothetical protein AB1505_27845, partial [Candidatus Latescibacterota bacterium]